MPGPTSSLRLTKARGGVRYALGDRVLSGGDVVELCCAGGWLAGRFEWDDGMDAPPRFYFSIELEGGGADEQVLDLPEGALLRLR